MLFISSFVKGVDSLNEVVGRLASWLTLGTVLVCFLVVVLRYAFNIGFPWMQEFYVWESGCIFMLGAGYTMLHRQHVSVDIFYSGWSPRTQAWVDITCVIVFLFPWLLVLAFVSQHFILASWAIRETSSLPDGMPGLYLFKTTIWIFCTLLFLQGLSLIGRRILLLRGHTDAATELAARP